VCVLVQDLRVFTGLVQVKGRDEPIEIYRLA
jgi:hypothetical protein